MKWFSKKEEPKEKEEFNKIEIEIYKKNKRFPKFVMKTGE